MEGPDDKSDELGDGIVELVRQLLQRIFLHIVHGGADSFNLTVVFN